MTKRRQLLTTALTLCLTLSARHVPLRIVSQTPVEGVEEARSMMFDHYGLMWVGTDQGVTAYDGYLFKTYRSDAYSPGTLPNNNVRSMAEDQRDGLWIGTRDGVVRYDRRRGQFKTYHLRSEQARSITTLFITRDGTVWAGSDAGVSRYDAEKDDFIDINMPNGVRAFAEDSLGRLYIGTWEGGLLRLDRRTGKMAAYPRMNERNTVASLLMDSRGRLWIGTWEHGIVRMDRPDNEQAPDMHVINDGRGDFRTFHRLVEDSVSHAVWGCCIEGLTRVDLDDETDVENYPLLSFCYNLVTDGHGNLWVMTRQGSIAHLTARSSPFHFSHLDPAGQVLPVNRIQTLATADGRHFWLGLQPYGLAFYDRQENRVSYNNQIPGFGQMTGTGGISVQTISSVLQRDGGETWLGSSRGIIIWKEGEAARLLARGGLPFVGDGSVNTLCRLSDGTVALGMSVGVGLAFSETKGRMLTMREDGSDFSSCDVQHIMEDHQHRLWVATENEGIIRISGNMRQPESLSYHHYAPDRGNYPLDEATACYEDADQRLWAISNSGGLFLHNADKDCFEPVNHRFHIQVGSIYSIMGDGTGGTWLSTNRGLLRLKTTDQKTAVTCYSEEDGLEGLRFSANGCFTFGQQLFYGSDDGFFSFSPKEVAQWRQTASASLIVSELIIDDRPYRWLEEGLRQRISADQPFYTREITIPSSVRKFSVVFSLLAYHNQRQCRYAYQLKGYDGRWHYTDAEDRRATYQNLPAGSYELMLRAIDSYGQKVDLPYTITVRVLPPWYLTWWARLAYALLLVTVVYAASQWYKNRVNRRARLQQRVSELIHYRELMVMKQFEGARKALESEEQQHSSPDELFIQRAIDCVKQHLDDGDYDREQFARDMCVSSSTLYNKLRSLTGQSVTAFINAIRLKEACSIMRQEPDIKMTELSMRVGFNTPKYFAKLFKKEFGCLPSEYAAAGKG